MKKVLLPIIAIIPFILGGCAFLNGNADAMLAYLEESDVYTVGYNELIDEEYAIAETGTEEELTIYTEETLIPELEAILAESKAYGDSLEQEELKTLHAMDTESMEKYIAAQYAWLEGNQDEADTLFTESEELIVQYEEDLDELAVEWGVEIEWEE